MLKKTYHYFYPLNTHVKQQKEITIYDIAEKMGLSPATISRALNDNASISQNTRKKVQALAEELGYRHNTFASSLRLQRTHTIGVILHELNSYFVTAVLAGIEKIATQSKYNLIIAHSAESAELEIANARNLFHKRVDGIIASLSFDTANISHFKQFRDRNIPVVFFDRVFEAEEGTKVIINNSQAGYDATAHLISQGCKRIAHITSNLKRNVYSERLQGYKRALLDNKLKYDEKLIVVDGFSEEDAIRSAKRILAMKPLPDGIFITNDFCAAEVMQVLKDAGVRIPEDIAIVGFNNDPISRMINPRLTTINYPGFEMGQIAARSLINHLNELWDINLTNTIVIKSNLVIRDSSLKNAHTKKAAAK
jgi:LacI family transcriptional regulator